MWALFGYVNHMRWLFTTESLLKKRSARENKHCFLLHKLCTNCVFGLNRFKGWRAFSIREGTLGGDSLTLISVLICAT